MYAAPVQPTDPHGQRNATFLCYFSGPSDRVRSRPRIADSPETDDACNMAARKHLAAFETMFFKAHLATDDGAAAAAAEAAAAPKREGGRKRKSGGAELEEPAAKVAATEADEPAAI